jgi:hypothetical protein
MRSCRPARGGGGGGRARRAGAYLAPSFFFPRPSSPARPLSAGQLLRAHAALQPGTAAEVATLRADWTNKDPRITAELAVYNRSAVPFNVIWLPGKDAPVILPELLTPGSVLDVVK